jgi:hypothetical protein
MKGVMNGDNGPHMPPPLTQQQYMNGQQMRAPPGPGYPPMPGQQPGPGGWERIRNLPTNNPNRPSV